MGNFYHKSNFNINFSWCHPIAHEPPTIRYSDRKITSLCPNEVIEATIGDELTLLVGASVVITCPISGLPTPTVQWKKDDEDLSEFGRTLTVNNVTTMDTGTFTCEAVNRAGRISRSSEFRVIGKLVISPLNRSHSSIDNLKC